MPLTLLPTPRPLPGFKKAIQTSALSLKSGTTVVKLIKKSQNLPESDKIDIDCDVFCPQGSSCLQDKHIWHFSAQFA